MSKYTDFSKVPSYTTIQHEFRGIRVLDSVLYPVHWRIELDMFGIPKSEESNEDNNVNISTAYHRVLFWLEKMLTDVIVLERNTKTSERLFFAVQSNTFVHMPTEPDDDIIAQTLFRKLTAIGKGYLRFGKTIVKSDDSAMITVFNPKSDSDFTLPTAENYLEHAVYDTPWWDRYDLDTYDFTSENPEEIKTITESLNTKQFLDDFDDAFIADFDTGTVEVSLQLEDTEVSTGPRLIS